jgi:hypothetical protein
MNAKRLIVWVLAIALLSVIVLWLGCKWKATGTTDSAEVEEDILIQGKVVNKYTQATVSNATVTIKKEFEVTTDEQGYYKIKAELVGDGECEITAYADGYGYGSTIAKIDLTNNGTVVNTIQLLPLNPPVAIGSSGGTITQSATEGLSNNTVTLSIPNGALSQATNISVTPFEGVDVPSLSPDSNLNMATVHIAPVDTGLSIEATLTFPLPLKGNLLSDSIPLLKFDKKSFQWIDAGIMAKVDTVNNTASAKIRKLGTFSPGIRGMYEESKGDSQIVDNGTWKKRPSSTQESWQATVEYPNGIPYAEQYSQRWLKNVVSQNTRLTGGRTSFFDPTYTLINCYCTCFIRIIIIYIYIPENVIIWVYDRSCRCYRQRIIYNKLRKIEYRVMRHDQGSLEQ